jgi:hypothetical protein
MVALALFLVVMSSCSSTGAFRSPRNPDPIINGEVTEEKARQALEMKLAREVQFLQENWDEFKGQVVTAPMNGTSYFYKYYDEFPEGPQGITVTITPTNTLSPPYTAEAKCRKIRYQTRFSKTRSKAGADDDFIRDEGIQKNSYKFDGSVWRMKSSIFEVTKTSVHKEDQWVASQGRVKRVEEEKPEYFIDKVRTLFGLLD